MVRPVDDKSVWSVSFFERLDADAPVRFISKGPEPVEVLDSIKRNVTHLLNTRMGESLSAPELGLVDFNDATLGTHDLALQIRRAIKHCLERYEPRITNVDIRVSSDDTTLFNRKFHIIASVDIGALHKTVEIDLLLDNSKKYRVL